MVVPLDNVNPLSHDGLAVSLDGVEAKDEVPGDGVGVRREQRETGGPVQVTRHRGDMGQECACALAVLAAVGPPGDGLVHFDNRAAADLDGGRDLDIWQGLLADLLREGQDVAVGEGDNGWLLEKLAIWREEAGSDVDGERAAGKLIDHDPRFWWQVEEGAHATWSSWGGDCHRGAAGEWLRYLESLVYGGPCVWCWRGARSC